MLLEKINRLTNWQAAIIIVVVGCAVFASGIANPFLGDDSGQIVNNPVVHSVGNMKLFFEGGTFYVDNGSHAPLYGVYFRPLMTTTFSLLYTLFGPHPIYFHLVQFAFCIGGAFLLYLFFRYSFKPALALFLALVFLVHPVNSQNAFAVANMQDALYFFFGILGFWLLLRFRSMKSLATVALCFFLSLLAKEVGLLFIGMALVYLFWWNRRRSYSFIGIMVAPVTLWLVLKVNAVGWHTNPANAPIDSLHLGERLLTIPSIVIFYISKLIFPFHLASGYYWTQPHFTLEHFFFPLILEIILLGIVIYLARVMRRDATEGQYFTYLFFAIWAVIGFLPYLQIIPLDMTASGGWIYFSTAGMLGMIGTLITTLAPSLKFDRRIFLALALIIVTALGVRTAVRGVDWHSTMTLAYNDVRATKENYSAYNIIAIHLDNTGQSEAALPYVRRSITIFPTGANYRTLGDIYYKAGNYSGAKDAFISGLTKNNDPQLTHQLYDNTARIMLWQGDPNYNRNFIISALRQYPQDGDLWLDLAVLDYQHGNKTEAKAAILQAYNVSPSPAITSVYRDIASGVTLSIAVPKK